MLDYLYLFFMVEIQVNTYTSNFKKKKRQTLITITQEINYCKKIKKKLKDSFSKTIFKNTTLNFKNYDCICVFNSKKTCTIK